MGGLKIGSGFSQSVCPDHSVMLAWWYWVDGVWGYVAAGHTYPGYPGPFPTLGQRVLGTKVKGQEDALGR